MNTALTFCDCVLLLLHGSKKPMTAYEVAYYFRHNPIGTKIGQVPVAGRVLNDLKLQGLVIVGDTGFSLSDAAKEKVLPRLTEHLSDEELARFNQ